MTKPAFIVEGVLEQRVIQKVCPDAKVVILGANGDEVAINVVAKHIEAKVRMFSNRHWPVFVIMDREKRHATCDEITHEILKHLRKVGHDEKQFIIIVNDRDIESLMLSHVDLSGKYIAGQTCGDCVDGTNGETELRKRLSASGVRYHKTTVGVDLMLKCVPSVVMARSPNFRAFFDKARPHCAWLRS